MKTKLQRYIVKGIGKECNRCGQVMERRTHSRKPLKTWFYTEWDYCKNEKCLKTVMHYDEFKSSDWKENDRQQSFLRSI